MFDEEFFPSRDGIVNHTLADVHTLIVGEMRREGKEQLACPCGNIQISVLVLDEGDTLLDERSRVAGSELVVIDALGVKAEYIHN